MNPFTVRLKFYGDLPFFLKSKNAIIERRLSEKTSIKDVIESCGVPHPEVDLILINSQSVAFTYIVDAETNVGVYPVTGRTLLAENRLQRHHMKKFIADGHLGKLVRDLRLLGFDILYDRAAEDRQLLGAIMSDERALLTRDRRLLMHRTVRHGYYLRSQNPLEQTIEVVRRFDLFSAFAPFTRCLTCNAFLEQVEKSEVTEQLEPLTKIYYEQFRRCTGCGRIYWPGSHFDKLRARIEGIRATLTAEFRPQNQT